MVIEQVTINVKPGQERDFERAMIAGKEILEAAAGSRGVQLIRGVESPSKFVLRIGWDSIDAHTAFTQTPGMGEFRALAGPFFADRPAMEHFAIVS